MRHNITHVKIVVKKILPVCHSGWTPDFQSQECPGTFHVGYSVPLTTV